jgi:hypothetical protein
MGTIAARALPLRSLYRRLPEEVRRSLRPLNLVDEAASLLPPPAAAPVRSITEMGRRLAHLHRVRYRVRRLEGVTAAGLPFVGVLATDEHSARYWRGLLFAGAVREEIVATVRALAVPRVAERLAGGADLSLWQVSWPASLLVRRQALVPSWVPLWLPTDRPLDAIITGDRSGRAARKNDVRRIERLELSARLVQDPAAWDRFRRELYEPYVRGRFGDLGVVLPPHAFRHARRHGWLLLLDSGTETRSGALLEPHGEELRVLAFGASGSGAAAQAGVEACYYHSLRLAVERGFRRLALGSARPVLTDGVLRYKRKWGGRLGSPQTFDRFLLRQRNTPPVRELLTATPLVVEYGGGLAALVGACGVDPVQQLSRVDVPGLREIVLLSDAAVDGNAPRAPYSPLRVVGPANA